jgi:hypothetical protein
VVAVPLAVAATHLLDLDPGDTQLVRDAGFWGLVLGTVGTLGFAGQTQNFGGFEDYQEPSSKAVAVGGLVGLYGGLACGALAASQSEVSLERVRVATWGGYGGALVGALLMTASDNDDRDVFRGLTSGGLLGLTITFALSGRLDGIPADTPVAWRRVIPTVSTVATADGSQVPALGIIGALRDHETGSRKPDLDAQPDVQLDPEPAGEADGLAELEVEAHVADGVVHQPVRVAHAEVVVGDRVLQGRGVVLALLGVIEHPLQGRVELQPGVAVQPDSHARCQGELPAYPRRLVAGDAQAQVGDHVDTPGDAVRDLKVQEERTSLVQTHLLSSPDESRQVWFSL